MKGQKYGIGLEAEGYIIDSTGHPIPRIKGRASSAYVIDHFKRAKPELVNYLWRRIAFGDSGNQDGCL